MPFSPLLLSSVLLLAGPSTAPSTAPTTLPSPEVAALVDALAGEDAAARDSAQTKLLEIGEDALPALEAARKETRDPDTQVRLDTLLVQIHERADVGATHITLKFDDTPLDQVLAALSKQAHMQFAGDVVAEIGGGQANRLPRLSLDLVDVSYWRAIEEIQSAGNVVFFPQPDGWRVQRNFGQNFNIHGSEAGAFLIQPTMASYSRNIAYSRNFGGDGENFNIQFQVFAEPKIKLGSGMGQMTLERAVDSNGNDLLLAQQRTNQFGTGGGMSIGFAAQLKYPKNPGTTITELRGNLRFSIARRSQQLSTDDLVGGQRISANIDGARIRVEPSPDETPRGGVSFTITVDAGADPQLPQRFMQNFQQMIHVTDSRDTALRFGGFNPGRNDGHTMSLKFTYLSPQPQTSKGPYKLRIDVPTSFREIDVPFELKDLKMP